ncbi:MAG TPA: S24 family peptidase [Syntrophomonas sp.]|nr:S24 family peptidase [Syntrophomonas sp.]
MEIRERIKKFREEKGLSSRRLGEMVDLSQSAISKIELGKQKIDINILEKIADALEISLERLTGEAASCIIEERCEEMGITLDEIAANTNVSLHWLQNLDTFIPGQWAGGEVEYTWITRVAKYLGLPGGQLRAALARQEVPHITEGEPETTPEIAYGQLELDSKYLRRIPRVGRVAAGNPILALESAGDYIVVDTRINRINGNELSEYFALEVTGQSMEPTIHDNEVVLVRRQPTVEPGEIGVFRCNDDEATIKRFAREGGKAYLIPDNKQFPVMEAQDCVCIGKVLQSIRRNLK